MSEQTACRILFFTALFLSVFLGAIQPEEVWYRVSSSELSRLETLWQNSETSRQKWESQARVLRSKAETLQKDSEALNETLKAERETTKTLRESYETYAKDQSAILSQKQAELDKALKARDNLKTQRNIFAGISVCLILAIVGFALTGNMVNRLSKYLFVTK